MLVRSVAPLLLSLALVAACGGDQGLPKDEFVQKAEALCSDANDALDSEPEPQSPDEVSRYFETLLATADRTTGELEDLAAEQPDSEEIDRIFLTPLRGQVTELQSYLPKIEEAAADGEQGLAQLEEPDLPQADIQAMEEYGFESCVETARTD